MKAAIALCVFGVTLVAAAPTLNDGVEPQASEAATLNVQPQILREKRSQYPPVGGYGGPSAGGYGGPSAYASPCGSIPLPIAPLPAALPAPSPYLQPAHGYGHASYGVPHGYGYGGPHYRADEMGDEQEMFFPDMNNLMPEHMPMARYGGYGASAAPAAHIGGGIAGLGQLAPVASGPAFGVFPNANVGGCNVPLLLSCSPSIVPGRLVKSGYGGGYAVAAPAANAYRGVDESHLESHEEPLHEEHEVHHDQITSVSDASHTNSHQ